MILHGFNECTKEENKVVQLTKWLNLVVVSKVPFI